MSELELRCLLSSVMAQGSAIVAETSTETETQCEKKAGKHHSKHQEKHQEAAVNANDVNVTAKKVKAIPQLAGTWKGTTHFGDGPDVISVVQLTQHGKKLTGTITNDGQPPGKIKAKIIVTDATSSSIATTATTQKQVKIVGKMQNFSVDSDFIAFESDFDPWEIPDLPDPPDPWDDPFDIGFDPLPPDYDDPFPDPFDNFDLEPVDLPPLP